jgi:predicted GNAT family N-acyltransferase
VRLGHHAHAAAARISESSTAASRSVVGRPATRQSIRSAAVRSALVEQFVHRCGGHGEARQNCDLDDAHGGVSP